MAEEKVEEGAEGSAPAAGAAPKKKLNISPIQIGLSLQLIVLIGAGALIVKGSLFVKRPDLSEHTLVETAIESLRDDEKKIEIVDLEEFVVNLSTKAILKTHIQLEVSDAEVTSFLKARKPAIRSRVLALLGTQSAEQSQMIQGKLLLKDAIREALNEELTEHRESGRKPASVDANTANAHEDLNALEGIIRDVYFVDFVVTKS